MTDGHRDNNFRRTPATILLCCSIFVIMSGAGFMIYRSGRDSLLASIEERLAQELGHIRNSTQQTLSRVVESMESWAQQPVMARVLDADPDHDIAELLDTLVLKSPIFQELTCIDAQGRVVASSNTANLGKTLASPETDFARSGGGPRYVFARSGDILRATVPITIEFDEREVIGVLQGVIRPDSLLKDESIPWSALCAASGDLIVQRGPAIAQRTMPTTSAMAHPEFGRMTLHAASIDFPSGGKTPQWRVAIAEPLDVLLRPINLLWTVCVLLTVGATLLIVVVVMVFSRRQRALLVRLAYKQELVHRHTEALEAANRSLEHEVRERMRAKEALQRAKDELEDRVIARTEQLAEAVAVAEEANRVKSEFLTNMSHEIRTPLHGILSFARFGKDKALTAEPEKLLDYFERIDTSGQRLLILLTDILDLAKMESGSMRYEFKSADLRPVLRSVQNEFQSLLADRNIVVSYAEPDEEVRLTLDENRMSQVVRNLLSNAAKFSPDGGTVRIETDTSDVGVRVSVRDQGMGIPEDELESVFDKFVQSSKTRTGAGGTGLGLSICREIVEAHQGRIWCENHPAGGAVFRVDLPLAMNGDFDQMTDSRSSQMEAVSAESCHVEQ